MLAHCFGILEMCVWIPLKSSMKPLFHAVGDHSSVFAERVDLNSTVGLNYADPLSAMPKRRSQKNLDRMLISVYTDACNFCGSAHLTCAIGMRCPSGNKCIWTWQPSSCLKSQTFRLILPSLCWSINSRQEMCNEGSYGLHQQLTRIYSALLQLLRAWLMTVYD